MSRNVLATALVLAAFGFGTQAFAQGPAAQPQPQAPANVPVSKMAVIYSEAFQDPKIGISRFTASLTRLNNEFQKVQDDLNQTAVRLKGQQEEINRLQQSGTATPAQIQAKIETLDQQKRDYTRSGEDAKAQYQRRYQDLFLPLQDEVSKALDAFAKERGITMIIDRSQVQILYAAESMDITRTFINYYNAKYPATAQTTPPK